MYKAKSLIMTLIIILSFLVLHNPLIYGISNIASSLRKDNTEALEKNAYLEKIDNLENIIADYENSLENFKIYSGSNYVLSKIALRDLYDFYDILSISLDSPVNNGNAVINEDGLVGIITSSDKSTAKVSLITNNDTLSVKVGKYYGILGGYDKEKNELIVHNLNNYAAVEEGTEVTTSGFQDLDEGIKIGTVKSIKKTATETILYVTPYVDFDELNYLMVIKK